MSGYATYFDEPDTRATRSGDALTRAWSIPAGYVAYDGGYQPIAIAFTQNGKKPMMGYFFMVGDKWRTSIDDIKTENYNLYGFIPNMAVIKYDITDRTPTIDDDGDGDSEIDDFAAGAIMTLQDVPSVMPNDLCVVIGAKEGPDKEHDNGLRQGDFNYAAKAFTGDEGEEVGSDNYVFLLFDHLYAALRVRMRVHEDYAKLRTIKLKSLKLSTKAGDDDTKDKTNIVINLQANDGSTSPIQSVTYTPAEGSAIIEDGMEFWSNKDGYELTTDFQPFIGHFMPSGITWFTLTSIYDVYDTKGNLIREDCKAVNSVLLSNLIYGQTETARGKRYTVNLTILPTYLYMLSDPDLDNPKVIIDN